MEKTSQNAGSSLGVVAISFNEEKDLPGFLDHLVPWVDEIVIVDDGSTDATKQIVDKFPQKVKFIQSPRSEGEYFSHQRNKGIDAAKSDWLIHLDIDERIPPALANEIQQSIQNEDMDAYRYRRLNYFLHRPMRGGGWQDWNLVHLARKPVFRFGGMYHEECIVDAPVERIGQLKEKIWHLNDDSYRERMNKSNMYCQEQANNLLKRGLQIRWWHLLALPFIELIKKYVKKKGYRDGTLGLLFSLHASCATFKACALVWDKQNPKSREMLESDLKNLWNNFEEAKIK